MTEVEKFRDLVARTLKRVTREGEYWTTDVDEVVEAAQELAEAAFSRGIHAGQESAG